MTNKERVSIFWFRRDLRLNDNHGLFRALNGPDPVLPIFIFDKNILESLQDTKDKRVTFIHQSLERINRQLIKGDPAFGFSMTLPLAPFKNFAPPVTLGRCFSTTIMNRTQFKEMIKSPPSFARKTLHFIASRTR